MNTTLRAKLVEYQKGKNPDVFAELFDEVAPRLWQVAFRLTNSSMAAEDALQETFLRVISHIDTFDPTRDPLPWLNQILVNVLRRSATSRDLPLEEQTVHATDTDRAALDDLEDDLKSAIEALPRDYADVFTLLAVGETPKEISARLAVPQGTIRSRIHRGIEMLRRKLSAEVTLPAVFLMFDSEVLASVRVTVLNQARATTTTEVVAANKLVWAVSIFSIVVVVMISLGWPAFSDEPDALQEVGSGSRPSAQGPRRNFRGAVRAVAATPSQGPSLADSRPTSRPQESSLRFVRFQFVAGTRDAQELSPSHIKLIRDAGKKGIQPKESSSDRETFTFPVDESGETLGELPQKGSYSGELYFKDSSYVHHFNVIGVGAYDPKHVRVIRYAFLGGISWAYQCDDLIKAVSLSRSPDKDELTQELHWDRLNFLLDQPALLPAYLLVELENGKTWRKRIAGDPELLKIEFDEAVPVHAVNLKTGENLRAFEAGYTFDGAFVRVPSNKEGRCLVPENTQVSIAAQGYVRTQSISNEVGIASNRSTVPLIQIESAALRFIDSQGTPMSEMWVLFGWADSDSNRDKEGVDPWLRGKTNSDGIVVWPKDRWLDLRRFTAPPEYAQQGIKLFLRNAEWQLVWQSEVPLVLRDLVAARIFQVKDAPRFRVRLIRNPDSTAKIRFVRGRALTDETKAGRVVRLSAKAEEGTLIYDFGPLATELLEVIVHVEGQYPQSRIFKNTGDRVHDFPLPPLNKLTVTVRDAQGLGVPKVSFHINALSQGHQQFPIGHGETNQAGQFEIGLPKAGPFFVNGWVQMNNDHSLWPPQILVSGDLDQEIEFLALKNQKIELVGRNDRNESLAHPVLCNPFFSDRKTKDFQAMWLARYRLGGDSTTAHVHLPCGIDIEAIAVAPGAKPVKQTIRIAEGQSKLSLILPSGPGLSGRLVDSEGEGISGSKIEVTAIELEGIQLKAPDWARHWQHVIRSNENGEFYFQSLTPGKYRMRVLSETQVLTAKVIEVKQDFILSPITIDIK